jgi:DNA polymerase-1
MPAARDRQTEERRFDVGASPRLFAFDVMPLLYRSHFAFLRNPRMTNSGVNTSALFGFAATLVQVLEEQAPSHAVLVLDSTTPTFRHQEYPAYKAQRQKMPEDIGAAIPMAQELAAALRIPVLRVDGFEADDILGTLAAAAAAAGLEAMLVTPDKDAAQLVGPTTRLYRPGKAGATPEILDAEGVCRQWGLKSPRQMIDLLGLEGDASDNIPGVAGVGEKTALALLQQYGSLDNVLAHAAELKGKLAEKVAASRDDAILSRRLATIRTDVPLPVGLDELARRDPDRDALAAVLAKYELAQLSRRLLGAPAAGAVSAVVPEGKTFRTIRDTPHDYVCARSEAQIGELLAALATAPEWAFDTETTGTDPRNDRLVGLSFATAPGRAWYVPVPEEEAGRRKLLARFAPLLADASKSKVAHNLKFDLTVLRRHGVAAAAPLHDTLLAHYVYDGADRHNLDHVTRLFLDYDKITTESLIGPKGKDQKSMADLPPEAVSDYACEDADMTLQLHARLRQAVRAAGGLRALEESEEPLVPVLADMEEAGIRLDPAVLATYGKELEDELRTLERRIRASATDSLGGRPAGEADGELALDGDAAGFNLASPKQMGELLFDRLKLDPDAKRTASGQYATDEDTLQKLAGRHPIVDLILDHRACSKLKSTYVDKLPGCMGPDGRVRTTFHQHLTETGRLSSSDPNLQNIPIRTERGRRIRGAFVAADTRHVLLSADYSQIELRVMAALSGDPAMKAAFAAGADIHAETAARVYGVPRPQVTAEMRQRCKMVNFGIIYGISAFGLSQRLGIPRKQAAELIDAYFAQYPGVKAYMERTVEAARRDGFVRTLLGRRRFLRDIASRNATARQAAERTAINTPVQGSAADLVKLAMVRIHAELRAKKLGSRMVLQVHDELLFDVPRGEEQAVAEIVRRCMTEDMGLDVPLAVEVGSGATWLDAH